MLFNRPNPDFERLRKVLLRQGEPDRVPFIELFADREVMEAVVGEPIPLLDGLDRETQETVLQRSIRFWYDAGYDYIAVGCPLITSFKSLEADDTATLSRGQRSWLNESSGLVNNWQDFEAYPWPRPEDIDYFNLEFIGAHLPDGMRIIYESPGGQLENMMWMMGYVPLALALKDDPALVEAVANKVGEIMVNIFSTAAEMPGVGALWLGDDMGFKTGTLISPQDLRQYVFPWQKKLAEIAHAHDMPFLLHSCGKLSQVMDELIEDVGIDAKHSFEDVIQPVAEAKREYGDRIAVLGGVDVDFLCRSSEDQIRAYTRRIIDDCAPGGGWALGTGNTVTNYIPLQNYLAMLDEGHKYGAYR
ncbi:MAG: uroporphyrinogen decarboxylase family protein [Chloroflexota bacterium]|nr:uroporphyrinogen decarboxylase family protein [Chloroflexota bacterium]